MIKSVLPGQRVRIIVQAVNGNHQGVASAPIEFTVPVVEAAGETLAPKPESTPTTAETTGGVNGHANGRPSSVRV